MNFEEELRLLHRSESYMMTTTLWHGRCVACHVVAPCPTIQLLDKHVSERREALLNTDWADRWDSLPPAPDLVPRGDNA